MRIAKRRQSFSSWVVGRKKEALLDLHLARCSQTALAGKYYAIDRDDDDRLEHMHVPNYAHFFNRSDVNAQLRMEEVDNQLRIIQGATCNPGIHCNCGVASAMRV